MFKDIIFNFDKYYLINIYYNGTRMFDDGKLQHTISKLHR